MSAPKASCVRLRNESFRRVYYSRDLLRSVRATFLDWYVDRNIRTLLCFPQYVNLCEDMVGQFYLNDMSQATKYLIDKRYRIEHIKRFGPVTPASFSNDVCEKVAELKRNSFSIRWFGGKRLRWAWISLGN